MDTGGPHREFFRLLAMRLREGKYFQAGSLGSFFLCNNEGYRVRLCLAECSVVNILVFLLQAWTLGSYTALSTGFSLFSWPCVCLPVHWHLVTSASTPKS